MTGPRNPTVLELFAGIGGMSLGLERAGFRVVGQVELDPFCRAVLEEHWPEVDRHDDVCTAPAWWAARPRPVVDLLVGGFPCQPVSGAGLKRGQDDPRWLWPEMATAIAAVRPGWVLAENVPGLRTRGLTDVLSDLHSLGYTARAGVLRACEMGAPHPRARLFVLAHTYRERCRPGSRMEPARPAPVGTGGWASEPDVARMAHGIPAGVDRRRALGNAVVPAVAEHLGHLIHPYITTY